MIWNIRYTNHYPIIAVSVTEKRGRKSSLFFLSDFHNKNNRITFDAFTQINRRIASDGAVAVFVDILLTEKKRGFLTRYAISIYESENPKNKKEELFFNAYKECRTFAFVFDTDFIG